MSLRSLLDEFRRLPAFGQLAAALPEPGSTLHICGLRGSADAVLLAALAEVQRTRFFLVLADSVSEGERWLADLAAAAGSGDTAFYPPREGLAESEPHAEIAGERVETLEQMSRGEIRVLVTTSRALLERTRVPAALRHSRRELRAGQTIRPADLAAQLNAMGFERVPMVDDIGQYSVRGGVFDIYGFGMAHPARLEFWGDEISEIRRFQLLSQRSSGVLDAAVVLPMETRGTAETSEGDRVSLLQLLPPDTVVLRSAAAAPHAEFGRSWDEAAHHLELARRRGDDAPDREQLLLNPDTARALLDAHSHLLCIDDSSDDRCRDALHFHLQEPENVNRDIRYLRQLGTDTMPTMILCDNEGQAERLEELLSEGGGASRAALVVGSLQMGFRLPPRAASPGLRVLTDHEIFRRARRIRRKRRYDSGTSLEVSGLKSGDYVVHLEHGVGIYRGLERIELNESRMEVAVLEYEGGDRLNVPLYKLDLLERYKSGDDSSADSPPPRLHRLGGRKWSRQREKASSAINQMTSELLELYSRRRLSTRPPGLPDTSWQRQLESSFLFEDTPDQRKATSDVKSDLEGTRPMDRLLIGDVGYGKTEVAVRAAFKVVQSGRQVAILAPTTILADQHARTFAERLADFPVSVRTLSRFESAAEQKVALEELARGTVDIIIGTHRLLSPDVVFARLGLVVVDEEHRFGVKHKERLKALKVETDVLTLTATPIPRTLHLALSGLRDMTLMQTPPRDRSPVLTHVELFDDGLIEEGLTRELERGGQVFFVHNRIETIDAMAAHIGRLAPKARLEVAHGKMKERELEAVMRRFVAGDVDILVSTIIVESGLDVPNANTMFVNRADRLGLAQLYQLRGRVGRSHRRAYCYLLVADTVDADAEQRLRVLEHHTELGSGYRIALKDLELRGAGNLLGAEQSGHVHAVGFDLYLRMLDEAVRRIQLGEEAPRTRPAEITLDGAAYLPDDYIPDSESKLDVYRRISQVASADEIEGIRDELRDRFGQLPVEARNMLAVAQLRVIGGALGVEGILVHGDEARVNFRDDVVPRLGGLSRAFQEVQFKADIRRAHPLSLKLTRLGGAEMLEGLVHAIRGLQ